MSLVSFARASDNTFGPMAFFRGAYAIFAANKPMTWRAWDQFFALATEHVLVGSNDRHGNFVSAYPGLTHAVLQLWRSAKKARADGFAPWQWSQNETIRISLLQRVERQKQEAEKARRAEARQAQAEEKTHRSSRRAEA